MTGNPSTIPQTRSWRRWLGVLLCSIFVLGLAVAVVSAGDASARVNGDGPIPPDPGDNPNPNLPPIAQTVMFGDRTNTSMVVGWGIPDNTRTLRIERSLNGTVTTLFSGSATGAPTTYNDTGLPPDSRSCYRMVASNLHGTTTGAFNCQFTKDGKNNKVLRVQIRLMTGDVGDAGSDNAVKVSVGGYKNGTGGTTTIYPAKDHKFTRGSAHTYDLPNTKGIDELGDIHSLAIFKPGDDGWCLANAVLLVNDTPVFGQNFGSPCTWVGAGSPPAVTVSHETLRAHSAWNNFKFQLPPLVDNPDGTKSLTLKMHHDELESRIEAMVGDKIAGTAAYWNDDNTRGVMVANKSETVDGVTLDLKASVDWLPNPDVEVKFNLVASTEKNAAGQWILKLTPSGTMTDVDFPLWLDVLDVIIPCGPVVSIATGEGIPFCVPALADYIGNQVSKEIGAAAATFNLGSIPTNLTAKYDAEGSLLVTATLGQPKPSPAGPRGDICCVVQGGVLTVDPGPSTPPIQGNFAEITTAPAVTVQPAPAPTTAGPTTTPTIRARVPVEPAETVESDPLEPTPRVPTKQLSGGTIGR